MINPDDITTVRVDQLPTDSILLTDIFPFETLDDQILKKSTFQQLVDFININANALQYEIKSLFVTQEYIDNNINEAGLGINLLTGWRLATELDGLVTIGYGAVTSNIGGYGGSRDAIVVAHSHGIKYASTSGGTKYPETPYIGDTIGGDMQGTEITGVSGTNKNMQPYCVVLKIIKL